MARTQVVVLGPTIRAPACSVPKQPLPLPLGVPRQQRLDLALPTRVAGFSEAELQSQVASGLPRPNLAVEVSLGTRTRQADLGPKTILTPLLAALELTRVVACLATTTTTTTTTTISKNPGSASAKVTIPIPARPSAHQGTQALGRTTILPQEAGFLGRIRQVRPLAAGNNNNNQHQTRLGASVTISKIRVNPRTQQVRLLEALVTIPSSKNLVDYLEPTVPQATPVEVYLLILRITNSRRPAADSLVTPTIIRLVEVLSSAQSLL